MSAFDHCFMEWKEEFVSQERGNRVVHYYLKDSAGESILAVVGTERSLRHMFYVVAEEFLEVCGAENSIHAGFKWRSRREVVDWLTSMLSKKYLPGDRSKSPRKDSKQVFGSPKAPGSGSGGPRNHVADYRVGLAGNVKGHTSDIMWSGAGWTCGKQLKHYPTFCRNGTTIEIHSFVFIMAKEEDHYLAHVEDMYEDRKGQKKVKVRWFHHNQEVRGVLPVRSLHPKEVFITPYIQVISAECVDGTATVLTRDHYEKFLAYFPRASLARTYLCFRQFKSNRVKPFDLSKLRGYLDQAIFSILKPSEEDEDYSPGDSTKKGDKMAKSFKGSQRLLTDRSGTRISEQGRRILHCRSLLSSRRTEPDTMNASPFKVDEKIEVMCLDSGIRGCWFRCTVLQVSRKQIKVKYDDLKDEDGCGNLEEKMSYFRLAKPDKLGMRCPARLTMRPVPPSNEHDLSLEIGAPVDAWWSDGWWEGVVIGLNSSGDDWLHVYFPGENIYLNIEKKNLRISRDWVRNQWVAIEAKPDILSAIATAINPDTATAVNPDTATAVNPDTATAINPDSATAINPDTADTAKDELNTTDLLRNDVLHEEIECSIDNKELSLNENKTVVTMMENQSVAAVELMEVTA